MRTTDGNCNKPSHLVCSICQRQFSRLEHLRRHRQVHEKERPHRCCYCGKAFARKDAAQRHEQGHGSTTRQDPTKPPSLCQTCSPCAQARVKCSGGTPCNYCASRSFECTYRFRKQKRCRLESSENAERGMDQTPSEAATDLNFPTSSPHQSSLLSVGQATSGSTGSRNQDNIQQRSNLSVDVALTSPSSHQPQFEENTHNASYSPWPSHISATNWLPFDQNLTQDLAVSSETDFYHVPPNPGSTITSNVASHGFTDVARTQAPAVEQDSSLRYDHVSALISSMRTGLPGISLAVDIDDFSRIGQSINRSGKLYSDGAAARRSQSDRRIPGRTNIQMLLEDPHETSPGSAISWIDALDDKIHRALQNMESDFRIPDDVYADLMSRLCPNDGPQILPSNFLRHKDVLLRKEAWEYFVQLYFDNFHRFHPFLDRSLLCIPVWGWALCLATAAIGVRCLAISEVTQYGDTLCLELHNMLHQELDFGRIEDSLPYIQARALSAIGLCHSRQWSLLKCGYNAISLVFNSCQRLRLLNEDERIGAYSQGQDVDQVWVAWRFRETRRRTGLFIWIADCTLAYMSGVSPRLPLKHLKLLLPSSEELWHAETCQKWFEAYGKRDETIAAATLLVAEEKSRLPMQAVVYELWTKLKAPKEATDFATTAIIHVLIRRMWETVRYFEDPLCSYLYANDTSQSNSQSDPSSYYIAAIPDFAKQRNTTCDCLDMLHWDALSLSAKAGGHEGPAFLHLHLARLLLLTPVADLIGHLQGNQAPGDFLLPHDLHGPSSDGRKSLQTILTWAHEDRYKARLALIHAGAILWHVRRYPSESYVQPFAVFLAGIVLWAFGMYSRAKIGIASTGDAECPSAEYRRPSQNDKDERMPSFLQLDRPMDDELVQYFIRSGENLRIYLEGVPDLCSVEGPAKALKEVISLLGETTEMWSIARSYAQSLEAAISAFTATNGM